MFFDKIEEIKDIVLNSDDTNELRSTLIEIVELSSNSYKAVNIAETIFEQNEAKSRLTILTTLKEICQQRIPETSNAQAKFNYNFRMAAMTVLKKETYSKISELSKLLRSDMKQMQKELQQNKIE